MTDRQRLETFTKARRLELRRCTAAQRKALQNAERILKQAEAHIRTTLAGQPTQWQSYHLAKLQGEVARALREAGQALEEVAAAESGRMYQLGLDLVDKPLQAAGVAIDAAAKSVSAGALAPQVHTTQLVAMQHVTTDKMGLLRTTTKKINDQLALVISGVQDPGKAVNAIQTLLGGDRARALAAVRTELNTAYAAATQQRMETASAMLPGLYKQWRKSGKRNGRIEHAIVDGQKRKINEPFDVGGEKLMYPRDPNASVKNRVHCGCQSLPWMEHWGMSKPGPEPLVE